MFGHITSNVNNLHLGVLKKYGYTSNMISEEGFTVTDLNLLLEPIIKNALNSGLINFVPPQQEPSPESVEEEPVGEPLHSDNVSLPSEGGTSILDVEETRSSEENTQVKKPKKKKNA